MKNLLRWQYVVPRVLAMLVVLLTIQYGLCILGRERIIRAVAKTVGAKGDVAAARVSYIDGRVTLAGLEIADPRRPMRNLLSVGSGDFSFDTGLFLRRGALVGQGRVIGVQFFTERQASGSLNGKDVVVSPRVVPLGEQESQLVANWMKEVDAKFAGDWLPSSESMQLLTTLAEERAKELAALDDRLRRLEEQAEELRTRAATAEENPLRGGAFSADLPSLMLQLEAERTSILSDIDKLPDRFEQGRRAVVAARVRDVRRLRAELGMNASISQPLAAYLLRDEATKVASEIVGWLHWTRRMVPPRIRTLESGEPGLLLHTLAVEGAANLGGQAIPLCGTLTDFTTQPWLADRPLRLRLTSRDSQKLDLRATIDRTGPAARDELLVDGKSLPMAARSLGRDDGIRVKLAESEATINVSLQLDGETLSGEIQIVQSGVRMDPSVGSSLAHVPLGNTLTETLSEVRSLATRLSLSGTLDEPRCTLWSSLGPATAKAIDIGLTRAADAQTSRVMSQLERSTDERLTQLDRRIADGQAELLPRLSACGGQLSWLAAQYSSPQRLEAERLGRLPAGSLFR